MEFNHICSLDRGNDIVKTRFKLRKMIQVSQANALSKKFFRSWASVQKEKRRVQDLGLTHVIHPFSIFRMYWEPFVWILLYGSMILIPINIVFGPTVNVDVFYDTYTETTSKIELVFDSVHLADLILTFCTGYFVHEKREVVMRPRSIAKRYMRSPNFYLDLICSIPVQAIVLIYPKFIGTKQDSILKFIRISTLVKCARLHKVLLYFHNTAQSLNYHLRICLKYILLNVLVIHWLTCLFIFFTEASSYSKDVDNLILSPHKLILLYDFNTIYCSALYSVVSNLLNIKVLDVTNRLELTYDTIPTIIFFTAYAIFGFIISKILMVLLLQIVKSITSSEIKYYAIKSQLFKYMSYKMLPQNMSNRIISYYEYRFQRKYFRESTILDMLSDNLRRDINLYCCRTLIESVTLLKNLPADIISDVVSNLKYEVFLYNDLIVKAGTTGDCMYFIANGTVAVSTPTGKEICHLQDGAYFGEIALISKDQKRVANVVAIEICEIYRLDRRNFRTCFPLNSVFYRRIEQIAHERMQKTMLLEELHKKYILERTTKRKADLSTSQGKLM